MCTIPTPELETLEGKLNLRESLSELTKVEGAPLQLFVKGKLYAETLLEILIFNLLVPGSLGKTRFPRMRPS